MSIQWDVQEVKAGKHEVVQQAVKEVASERDSLKAKVSSLTKKVNDAEAKLQQAAKNKEAAEQRSASGSKEVKVCITRVA